MEREMRRGKKRGDAEATQPLHLGVICIDVSELLKAQAQTKAQKAETMALRKGSYFLSDTVSPRDAVASATPLLHLNTPRTTEKNSKKKGNRNSTSGSITNRGGDRERMPTSFERVGSSFISSTFASSNRGDASFKSSQYLAMTDDTNNDCVSSVSAWRSVRQCASLESEGNDTNPVHSSLSLLRARSQGEMDKEQPTGISLPTANCTTHVASLLVSSFEKLPDTDAHKLPVSPGCVVSSDKNDRRNCYSRGSREDTYGDSISPSLWMVGTLGRHTVPPVPNPWGAPAPRRTTPPKLCSKNVLGSSSRPHRLVDAHGIERVVLMGVPKKLPKTVTGGAFPAPRPRVATINAAVSGEGGGKRIVCPFRGTSYGGAIPSNRPKRF